MKLATLKDGTRDGTLLVVSKDLKRAQKADHIAPTLQAALDDWNYAQPLLVELSLDLEPNRSNRAFDLDPRQLMAPLPRAHQFADGSAYIVHAELIMRSQKRELPDDMKKVPLMYQGCSDPLLGPCDDILVAGAFAGQGLLARHRMVYDALGPAMHTDIHALSIRAYSPDEFTTSTQGITPCQI